MREKFSYSRITTYTNCPRAYQYKYILKIPEAFKTIEQHLGGTVHKILRWMYDSRDTEEVISEASIAAEFEIIWKSDRSVDLKIVKRGYSEDEYYEQGLAMCLKYWDRVFVSDDSRSQAHEKGFDYFLRDGISYTGIIDRISRFDDGHLRITDYKTGRTVVTPLEDLQLPSYGVHVLEEQGIDQIEICYEDLRGERTMSAFMNRTDIPQVREILISRVDSILEDQSFAPTQSGLCPWCGYSDRCREEDLEEYPESRRICPRCDSPLSERRGRYGTFIGCSSFPVCRYTRDNW